MDISSWNWSAIAIVCATFSGPIAAIQIQKYLEHRQERRRYKTNIYRTLMATRKTRLSTEHVQALSGIELAFDGRKTREKPVLVAWRAYLDGLNTNIIGAEPAAVRAWGDRQSELFIELLYQMSVCLGFSEFDKTYIRNSSYTPTAYQTLEEENQAIRNGLIAILTGKGKLPVESTTPMSESELAEIAEIRTLLRGWLRAVQPATAPGSYPTRAEADRLMPPPGTK